MHKFCLLIVFLIFLLFSNNSKSQNGNFYISPDIQLIHITDSLFVHITWSKSEKYGRFSSNGVLFIENGKALMVDTPIDDNQTRELVNYLNDSLNVTLTHFIAGHYHNDCIGGLSYLNNSGVITYSSLLTQEKCKELNLPIPQISFTDSLIIYFNHTQVSCYYLGSGHTPDNIVVYFNDAHVLFGGCMVKSNEARNMGNMQEANLTDWYETIGRVQQKFEACKFIVPGHGSVGGIEQFNHTLELIKQNKK